MRACSSILAQKSEFFSLFPESCFLLLPFALPSRIDHRDRHRLLPLAQLELSTAVNGV
jgi:hypothetical protein